MSTPFVMFDHTPPVKLNCNASRVVSIKIWPFAAGTCEVTLSFSAQDWVLKEGGRTLSKTIDITDPLKETSCEFMVEIVGPAGSLLLNVSATNADGQNSGEIVFNAYVEC